MENLNITDIKTFIGSKDFDESLSFYTSLGWAIKYHSNDLAELELGNNRFYLQNYFQREWCENSMLHITVEDATAWYNQVTKVLDNKSYGTARVQKPKKQDYGALVTFAWDPVGILLHFSELNKT